MRLVDLLPKEIVDGLRKDDNTHKRKKKAKTQRGSNNHELKHSTDIVKKNKNKKNNRYIERYNNDWKVSKRKFIECPYCGSNELELTSNGYYYCDICGIKVEKN